MSMRFLALWVTCIVVSLLILGAVAICMTPVFLLSWVGRALGGDVGAGVGLILGAGLTASTLAAIVGTIDS